VPDLQNERRIKPSDRLVNRIIEGLRKFGARRFTNAILRLIRFQKRDERVPARSMPARPVTSQEAHPQGPFLTPPLPDAPALLIFVPRRLRSRLIDGATGGYGYSHLAIDCGEVDEPTGKRVMIESMSGTVVRRSFQDLYGPRPFVRVSLAGRGIDTEAFCAVVKSKLGEKYDDMEALTWGEVDDPARQICSDLAAVALPRPLLDDIAAQHLAGRLPRRSVSAHHRGTPEFHAFVSPNAFAAYFGAPPGERLTGPDQHLYRSEAITADRPRRPRRAKLIYSPGAGLAGQDGAQLTRILAELQRIDILPEVHVVTPASRLAEVAADAIHRGLRLIIVAGGDGTVDNTMGALVGKRATLGILPTGTRNNVAHSLGIPTGNIPAAVALLREGRRIKIDVTRAFCNGTTRWFLEAGAVGLASALYPAADALQHGDITRAVDLLGTFTATPPGVLRLELDGKRSLFVEDGHMVVLANMPYFGARFHPASNITFDDGRLDLLVFGRLSKLELLTYAVQMSSGQVDDPRVAHYTAHHAKIHTLPAMPVMVDGMVLGDSPLRVHVHRRALAVMASPLLPPAGAPAVESGQKESAAAGPLKPA
jgi:diacylglycerol kinase (ATP)